MIEKNATTLSFARYINRNIPKTNKIAIKKYANVFKKLLTNFL